MHAYAHTVDAVASVRARAVCTRMIAPHFALIVHAHWPQEYGDGLIDLPAGAIKFNIDAAGW